MENILIYLAKASILLTIFFLVYHFLLRKETFFSANRWFLLLGIITSLTLPLFIFTKIIWVEPIPQDFSIPTENFSVTEFVPMEEPHFEINWFYVIGGIYLAGIFFLLGKFIKDIFSLLKILNFKKPESQERFKFIDTDKIQSPFSFFNYIIYNSNSFKQNELENIIAHEKVHSSQYHSLDMLFGQLFCIFFWFNPFSWFHNKAIAQNLEFIADSEALKQVSDKITYQKTLLKVSAPDQCIPITNHFYQSLIKKRIIMLNKNQSKRRNSWKYATVLPLLTLFMLQFQVETVAQEKEKVSYSVSSAYSEGDSNTDFNGIVVMSSTSEKDIQDYVAKFTASNKIKLAYKGIKRNDKEEIIEISFNYDDFNGTSGSQKFSNSGNPIDTILFEAKKDENGKTTLKITDTSASDKAIITKLATTPAGKDSTYFINTKNIKDIKDQKPVLVVVDGKVLGMSDKVDLPTPNSIVSITALKNETSIKKYGKDGKNGVIEVVTKKTTDSESSEIKNQNSGYSTSYKTYKPDNIIKHITEDPNVDYENVVIIIDGKKSTMDELLKIKPDDVVSTLSSENSIEIETKKNKNPKLFKNTKEPKVDFKINDNNSGFIIHKKSQVSDFEFYSSTLKKNGVTLKYSSIKRNKAGEITGLSLEIYRTEGNKTSRSWNSENAIPDIFVGRRNGMLIIMTEKVKEKNIEPKMFGLDNGDQVAFYDGNKFKVPGYPTALLENILILVNGKKAELSIFKTLSRISSVELIYENNEEKSGLRTLKITTP